MLCAISYYLRNLKNVKNTHGKTSLLVKLPAYFTKSKTPLWVFFMFLKLYKWYQTAQKLTAKDKVILDTVLKQKNLLCK